jgi:hypothetical protein
MMFADGFEEALVGVVRRFNETWPLYDYAKCLEVLQEANLSQEEAIEYMEYNVLGAYLGEETPCFAVMGEEGMEILEEVRRE